MPPYPWSSMSFSILADSLCAMGWQTHSPARGRRGQHTRVSIPTHCTATTVPPAIPPATVVVRPPVMTREGLPQIAPSRRSTSRRPAKCYVAEPRVRLLDEHRFRPSGNLVVEKSCGSRQSRAGARRLRRSRLALAARPRLTPRPWCAQGRACRLLHHMADSGLAGAVLGARARFHRRCIGRQPATRDTR